MSSWLSGKAKIKASNDCFSAIVEIIEKILELEERGIPIEVRRVSWVGNFPAHIVAARAMRVCQQVGQDLNFFEENDGGRDNLPNALEEDRKGTFWIAEEKVARR